jgi:hypothetical protein
MTPTFTRFARGSALLAAIAGLTYTVTFIVVVQNGSEWAHWTSSIALLVGALAAVPTFCGAFFAVATREREFALVALILGVAGALGSATHAAYDLAVLANPPGGNLGAAGDLPFAADPRGFATFALVGLSLALFGWLGVRTAALPAAVVVLAEAAGLSLLVIFVGRLTVLDPKSGLLRPLTALSGFVLNPALLVAFAFGLFRPEAAGRTTSPAPLLPAGGG